MQQTIFHKIIAKEIPADIVYEDKDVIVIKDIKPLALTHVLVIPKRYVKNVTEATGDKADIPGMLIQKARDLMEQHSIAGYKLMFHAGPVSEVPYMHLHVQSDEVLIG